MVLWSNLLRKKTLELYLVFMVLWSNLLCKTTLELYSTQHGIVE